jgi:hypothetical protein
MQNGEEADFSSEMPGVGGNFEHGLSAGAEEQIVEQPWVTLTQRVQLMGQGKDDVEVRYAEQVLFASCPEGDTLGSKDVSHLHDRRHHPAFLR